MVRKHKVEQILSCGISLHEFGVNNWALNKKQSLQALKEFKEANVPLLGGDVYEVIDSVPESNYDNWFCDQDDNESLQEFVSRSIKYAKDFIINYEKLSDKEIFFVLVT